MSKKYKLLMVIFLVCLFMVQTTSAFALSRGEAENALSGKWTNIRTGITTTITGDRFGNGFMTIMKYDSTGEYSGVFHIRLETKDRSDFLNCIFMLDIKKSQKVLMVQECDENWKATGGRNMYTR